MGAVATIYLHLLSSKILSCGCAWFHISKQHICKDLTSRTRSAPRGLWPGSEAGQGATGFRPVVHKAYFNAAEPVRSETIKMFQETFEPHGFNAKAMSPGYGLAEHTVYVCDGGGKVMSVDLESLETDGHVKKGNAEIVSCGRPPKSSNIKIILVEKQEANKDFCEIKTSGKVGEIWVSSKSASSSYWNKDESINVEKLQAKVPGRRGVYIRTGDLGFFDKSGELYVTGRSKDLIIIRGRNHAPEDIEYSVQNACKFLRPGCIAAIAAPMHKKASKMSKSDDLNGDTLCVIAEVRDGVDKGTAQKVLTILFKQFHSAWH